MNRYDYIFKWLRNATKEERHIEEMEKFAKRHPILFMKFHKLSRNIVHDEEVSGSYIKAKEEMIILFKDNKEAFEPVFQAIKKRLS